MLSDKQRKSQKPALTPVKVSKTTVWPKSAVCTTPCIKAKKLYINICFKLSKYGNESHRTELCKGPVCYPVAELAKLERGHTVSPGRVQFLRLKVMHRHNLLLIHPLSKSRRLHVDLFVVD